MFHPFRHKPVMPSDQNNPALADIIERNIQTLIEMRRRSEAKKTFQDHVADVITQFSGSMLFVYLHILLFGGWILINLGHTPLKPFDPFPFNLLTMVVSLEAIFLSTFVLVSQNRMGEVADKRADLDLQINLVAEHEITRILMLVDAIADHLGLEAGRNPELDELERDVPAEVVLEEIEARTNEGRQKRKRT